MLVIDAGKDQETGSILATNVGCHTSNAASYSHPKLLWKQV